MKKMVLKQVPDEEIYYNFEDLADLDYLGDNIIIYGNESYLSYGDQTAIDIIKNDYEDDDCGYDYETLEELEKIYGKEYNKIQISGYSQGDWQDVYYTDKVNKSTLDEIEALYFGKVDEFIEEEECISYIVPHDISWKGAKAICEYCGLDPDTTKILKIAGEHKVYDYVLFDSI